MRFKYTCSYLPNKVGSCPIKTDLNSGQSGSVHELGGIMGFRGTDWGSHELEDMASGLQINIHTSQPSIN